MPVAFSSATVNTAANVTASNIFNTTVTVGTGANRAMVVFGLIEDASAILGSFTTASYGGVQMTKATEYSSGSLAVMCWYLLSPNTGANTLGIQIGSNAALSNIAVYALTYQGVKQAGQPDFTGTTNSGGTLQVFTAVTTLTGTVLAGAQIIGNIFSTTLTANNNMRVNSTVGAGFFAKITDLITTVPGSFTFELSGATASTTLKSVLGLFELSATAAALGSAISLAFTDAITVTESEVEKPTKMFTQAVTVADTLAFVLTSGVASAQCPAEFLVTPNAEFLNLQSGNARPFYYIEAIISGVTSIVHCSDNFLHQWVIDGGLIDREKPALPGDRSSIFSSDVTLKVDNSTFRFSPRVNGSVFFNNDYLESPFNYWAGFWKQDVGGTALTAVLVQRGAFILENLQLDSRNGVAYMRLRDKFKRVLQREIGTRDISGTAIQYTVTGNVDGNSVLQSLFITGAGLTAGDLSLQTSTFTYNNLSLSQQSIAEAASLVAEATDGFLYTSRRGILTYLSNIPTFATASASFVIRESNYAENTFFEETKDDRLAKVILDYLSGTSTFVAAEITGTTGQVLSITNDSVQGSTEAYALAARTLGRYSGQVSKIRLESVWLPSLDINDRIEVHATALGLSGHIFDIYKIEEQPTLGIMTIYGITERGVKNKDTNKFFFWSDPSAAESGGNFTGATGESNGWQNNYFYWCRETTTAVQPAFDADGNNNNAITTGYAASGANSTGIENAFVWY